MLNVADLKGLGQTQQYEQIREGLRSGELTKPEAVELSTELRLPEKMRQSVSNSKVVALGYGDAGKGGAAGQKRLSKSSPLFLETSGSTTPEANRLDLPLDVFVAKLSDHNLVLRGSGVGTKLGYNEGALVEAERRIGFAVDVLTSVASGDLALAWEGDTPTNSDRRLVGAKNPNWGDVPHFLSGRDGLTLVSAQMGAAGQNPEHADYGYTAPTALKAPDKGLALDPKKPAEGDNINWDNIDWAGNRTFLEGPAAENVDLEFLVGAGPSAKKQIEAAFEIGRSVVYVPVEARDQKDGDYGPADSDLLPDYASRDAVYLLRPGHEPTQLDGLQHGVADAVALMRGALSNASALESIAAQRGRGASHADALAQLTEGVGKPIAVTGHYDDTQAGHLLGVYAGRLMIADPAEPNRVAWDWPLESVRSFQIDDRASQSVDRAGFEGAGGLQGAHLRRSFDDLRTAIHSVLGGYLSNNPMRRLSPPEKFHAIMRLVEEASTSDVATMSGAVLSLYDWGSSGLVLYNLIKPHAERLQAARRSAADMVGEEAAPAAIEKARQTYLHNVKTELDSRLEIALYR